MMVDKKTSSNEMGTNAKAIGDREYHIRLTDKMVLLGIVLGALYWILESVIDVFIFHEGNLLGRLIVPDMNELWMRLLIISFLISFGVYSQVVINKRKKMEDVIRKYAGELEERLNLLEEKGVSRYAPIIKKKNSYLIKEKRHERSLAVFSNLIKYGLTGLCLTTKHPDILKETYDLDLPGFKGETIWLTASDAEEGTINPSNLTAVHGKINEFTKKNENSLILFLGLEYIITLSGFEKSLKFLNSLFDVITINNSRLIIALDPETLDPRELSLLESALIEIKDDDLIRLGLK